MDDIIVREMMQNEVSIVRKIGRRAFTGVESLWVGKPKQALVAVKDGNIIGAVLYKFITDGNKKTGYIDYAFIEPDYHNQGVGSILYKAAADFLWEQGCDALTAIVKDDNVGSWGLFLKNGFYRVSLPELVWIFGFNGAFKQYFCTPYCFGIGMEYYVAVRNEICPSCKNGSIKQILSFLLANFLLILPVAGYWRENPRLIDMAFLLVLLFGVISDYIGTKFSTHRSWEFRFNNGGGFICLVINLSSVLPMLGNWYPQKYEKTKMFYKDMGITALTGWISLLTLVGILAFGGIHHSFARYVWQIGAILLFYRIIPFYPFESFGGRRVYDWNKWIYAVMTIITLAVIICTFVLPHKT